MRSGEPVLTIQETEKPGYLIGRQDNRKAPLGTRSAYLLHPRQIHSNHLPLEGQQGRERLLVRGGSHMLRVGEIDVGTLGSYNVMQIADALAQLVEHPCSFRREGHRAVFHDSFSTGCNYSTYVERPHYKVLLGPVARSYTARA